MAISRMGASGDQKSEGLEDMAIKVTAGQGGIFIVCPFYEGQHEIMEDCQNLAASAEAMCV